MKNLILISLIIVSLNSCQKVTTESIQGDYIVSEVQSENGFNSSYFGSVGYTVKLSDDDGNGYGNVYIDNVLSFPYMVEGGEFVIHNSSSSTNKPHLAQYSIILTKNFLKLKNKSISITLDKNYE